MVTYDVRLISGTYSTEGDEVIIELFGKERGGQSISLICSDFRPYFRIIYPKEEKLEALKNAGFMGMDALISELDKDHEVLEIDEEEVFVDNHPRKCIRVTIKFPWKVPSYRKKYELVRFTDADIPFVHRFIYDNNLSSCLRIEGEEVENPKYTTDLVLRVSDMKNISPFNPELKVLGFDIENSINTQEILCICGKLSTGEEFKISGPEHHILQRFSEEIRKHDPDVITGYNIDNYDIPFIMDRAEINGVQRMEWGRNHDQPRKVSRFWRVPGRIVADAWWNVKKTIRPKRETLAYVSQLLLGEGKIDVNASQIDREWDEDSDRVIEYCLKDADLALRLLMKIKVLDRNMDLASVSMLTVEDVMTSGTSTLVDSLLIREARSENIAINTSFSRGGKKEEKITGGFVLEPEAGLYSWVAVLDFKSMYPSIIISKNICFSTIDQNGDMMSPIGVRFSSKKKGVIPKILVQLMNDRDITKKQMKEAEDLEMKNYYNGLQEAIKVVMNTFYGVLASSFYRFTNPEIGASITAFARENIQTIMSQLKEEDYTVLYGDTDSIFVQSPFNELEPTVDFGDGLAKRFTKLGVTLEFEKILETWFTGGAKKRYFGKIAWPEEDVIVRGYETRRTDSFGIQVSSLEGVMKAVMSKDIDGAIEMAKEAVNAVLEEKVEKEALVISKGVKEESAYANPENMANVQAARKMRSMGYEVPIGMKVGFIVTDSKAKPMEVEPYVDGAEFKGTPDYKYYAERLALSISRITEVFGTDQDLLLGRAKQTTLFGGFGGGKGGGGKASPAEQRRKEPKKPKEGEVNLMDFA